MPDGDDIRRRVPYRWRSAFEVLSVPTEGIDARAFISQALAASLRQETIPTFAPAAALLKQVWAGLVKPIDALKRAAAVCNATGGMRQAALLAQALGRMIVSTPMGASPEQSLVEAYLRENVHANLFSKLAPKLLETNPDPDRVQQTVDNYAESVEPEIRKLAHQFVSDPTGASVRSPAIPGRRKKATKDLLNEEVE